MKLKRMTKTFDDVLINHVPYTFEARQIIPAPKGLVAIFDDEGKEIHSPILCLALTYVGDIEVLDYELENVRDAGNFLRLETWPETRIEALQTSETPPRLQDGVVLVDTDTR